ncbi:hypothetical protein PV328_011951, partial [Microctonus aethiopoides]
MASPMEIGSSSMDDKKKTTNRNVFNNTWLRNKLFKNWLRPTSNENKAFSSFCGIEMACKKSILIAHAKSQKHNKNSRIVDPTLPSASDDESYLIEEKEAKENIQKAVIEIAAYIATNNMPISSVDGLVALINRFSVMKGVPGNLGVTRKKCSNIINNVLGEKQSQDLSQNLNNNKFSVLVDESTTTAGNKLLRILVKYVAPNRELITELFELVNLDASDCSASKLYEAFESSFKKRNVPLTNIVATASDNTAVMVGKHNSFVTHLRKSIEQKTKSAIDIYDGFTNDEFRSYLLFLEFSLDIFNKFNALFQSRETQIHIIAERSEWILKQMAMCFLKPDAMNNITINSMAPDNILPTLSIKVVKFMGTTPFHAMDMAGAVN